MELRRNVISKKDYERYSVRMPFRVFLSRPGSRKRFLFGELEKLHPCFSDECTFDSKLKLGKKGLVSDVVVMNSLKLSEYKTRFLGKRLFLEGNPEKCVFGKNRIRNTPGLVVCAAIVGVVISLLLLAVAHWEPAGRWKAASVVEGDADTRAGGAGVTAGAEGGLAGAEGGSVGEGGAARLPGELTELFLSAVEGDSAFLSELEWKCDGLNESFFASVAYIHPDRLINSGDFEFSAVKYKENVPFFTAKGKCRVRRRKMNETELVWSNGKPGCFDADREVFTELRKIICGAGAELMEEKFNPWKIRFVLENATLDKTESLISDMAEYILKMGIAIKRLAIRKGGFDDFELEIETASDLEPFMGVNLSILEKRFRLFGLKNQREKVQSYQIDVGKKNQGRAVNNTVQPELRKIGEIRHKDGSFVVYFKNQQGKIVSEIR